MSAGAPPQTPLGELTALPQTHWLDLRGPTSKGRRGGEEKGRKGKGRAEPPIRKNLATGLHTPIHLYSFSSLHGVL